MSENKNLVPARFHQTQVRGNDDQEYEIYVQCAKDLGWKVKTYEEWKSS